MRIWADPRPRFWTGVYRLYSTDGALLYVGVGVDPRNRVTEHIRRKPWGGEIADVVIDWYQYIEVAHLAERRAIRDEKPLHNVIRYASAA